MGKIELEQLKITELRALAKERQIKNVSKLKKSELIALLQKRPLEAKPSAAEKNKGDSLHEQKQDGNPKDKSEKSGAVRPERAEFRPAGQAEKLKKIEEKPAALNKGKAPEQIEKTMAEGAEKAADKGKPEAVTETAEKNTEEKPEEKSGQESVVYSDPVRRTNLMEGVLEVMADGYGFLRSNNYQSGENDVYVSQLTIRRFNLKTGDYIVGNARQHEGEKFQALLYVQTVNGDRVDVSIRRKPFDELTPVYPSERMYLGGNRRDFSMRMIDLVAPLGKGQRGIIVAPPKAGKTTLLKGIANSITAANPEVQLIVLLIDERPEEVTDMQRSIKGDVIYSTFDEEPQNHAKVAEIVLERAKRLVEHKKDVVILLDSITRLARAYNLTIAPTGRTLSGGLDPGALYKPKRFFGAARKIEEGGSLTILATALIETGSRMDDMIFEEFKGTGNMEVHLDRKLQERRIFPAIDLAKSGTRKEELLLSQKELEFMWRMRRAFSDRSPYEVTENILQWMMRTENNEAFIEQAAKVFGG